MAVKVMDVRNQSGIATGDNSTQKIPRDYVGVTIVVGIAVAATLGLTPWLGVSMFADEGATLYSAHLSWSNLWAQSEHVDLVLLPYYTVVHGWLLISGSLEWVRGLSLLAYFGTIVLVGWLGLRIAGRWCGVITAVLTACSTLLVQKSLNARPYAVSTFLVVVCAVFLFKWLSDPRSRWLWAFTVSALLATAMQLFSLLAPISMLVMVLVVRRRPISQRLQVLLIPASVLAVVAGAWTIASAREVAQVNWIGTEAVGNRLLDELRGPAIGQFYDLALFLIGTLVLFKLASIWTGDVRDAIVTRISRDRDVFALAVGWGVVPTVTLAIVSLAHPLYSVRYVTASAPGAALLIALICVRMFPTYFGRSHVQHGDSSPDRSAEKPRHKIWATVLAAATALLLLVGYLGSAMTQQEDLKGPARYALQHAQNDDVLALPDHAVTSAVEYYLQDEHQHLRQWTQLGVTQRYVEGLDLSLRPSLCSPRRVLLIDDGTVQGLNRFEQALEAKGYQLYAAKRFNGSQVLTFGAPSLDTQMLFPPNGATLTGTHALLVASTTSIEVKIATLRFVLSGGSMSKAVIGRANLSFYGASLTWDTTGVPNGTYLLQSVITNQLGRSSCSVPISITVRN
jgi:hypothetical protein